MLIGLENKIEEFKKAIRENRLRQAYLFFGEPQIGKFTFASSLVNFLETGEFIPLAGGRPLIDAEFFLPSEEGSIGIESVRRLKKFLYERPIVSSRRSAVFDSAESLTPEAQNALLKIIEEPPTFSLIIFIARDSSVFFPTLASRFTKVYFPQLSQKSIEKFLMGEFQISSTRASLIAKQSFGRIGRAIHLLKEKKEEKQGERISDIEQYLEDLVFSLRKNLFKNSSQLAWLLERIELLKRYNLNEKLQLKTISQYLENKT